MVDDAVTARMMTRTFLQELGFQRIEMAEQGQQALELAAELLPQLMIVDWNMPEMNGLELVRALRSDPRFANIQILMATTETGMEKVLEALNAGANEYIMKPFNKAFLSSKLEIMGVLEGATQPSPDSGLL